MIRASQSAHYEQSWLVFHGRWVKSVTLTLGTACFGLEVSKALISQISPGSLSGGLWWKFLQCPRVFKGSDLIASLHPVSVIVFAIFGNVENKFSPKLHFLVFH